MKSQKICIGPVFHFVVNLWLSMVTTDVLEFISCLIKGVFIETAAAAASKKGKVSSTEIYWYCDLFLPPVNVIL